MVNIEKHGKAGEASGNCFDRELKAWDMYVEHGDGLSLILNRMENPGKHGETLLGRNRKAWGKHGMHGEQKTVTFHNKELIGEQTDCILGPSEGQITDFFFVHLS